MFHVINYSDSRNVASLRYKVAKSDLLHKTFSPSHNDFVKKHADKLKETDIQTTDLDKQTDIQTDRKTNRLTETDRQPDRKIDRRS